MDESESLEMEREDLGRYADLFSFGIYSMYKCISIQPWFNLLLTAMCWNLLIYSYVLKSADLHIDLLPNGMLRILW